MLKPNQGKATQRVKASFEDREARRLAQWRRTAARVTGRSKTDLMALGVGALMTLIRDARSRLR